MAAQSMPWQDDSSASKSGGSFKYKYHPGGDPKKPPKEAPSALNTVIVPNVTLPKVGDDVEFINPRFSTNMRNAASTRQI